jgi:hypothetical protein
MENQTSVQDKVFSILGYPGKMISGSKSGYCKRFPDNFAIFNANVCAGKNKIWHGDIDLTKSKDDLLRLASELNEQIFILYEMDGRFENEKSPRIENYAAVFNPDNTCNVATRLKTRYKLS